MRVGARVWWHRMRAIRVKSIRYATAFSRATPPKKVLAIGSAALSALAVARVLVLLVEAWVVVRDERAADSELIELCARGTAKYSADFRNLCLRKQSELAAPLLLKALLRAVSVSFADFSELVNTPGRIAMLVLFTFTGVTAPVAKALVGILLQNLKVQRYRRSGSGKYQTSDSDSDSDGDGDGSGRFRVVDVGGPPHALTRASSRRRIGMAVRRSIRRLALASSTDHGLPEIEEL